MSADRVIAAAVQATATVGQWPPEVVVGHLAHNDAHNWSPRIALMVNANRGASTPPQFTWYEPQGVAQAYHGKPVEEVAAHFMAARAALVAILRDLESSDWLATANHERFGTIDMTDVVMLVLGHDEEHRGDLVLGGHVS